MYVSTFTLCLYHAEKWILHGGEHDAHDAHDDSSSASLVLMGLEFLKMKLKELKLEECGGSGAFSQEERHSYRRRAMCVFSFSPASQKSADRKKVAFSVSQ